MFNCRSLISRIFPTVFQVKYDPLSKLATRHFHVSSTYCIPTFHEDEPQGDYYREQIPWYKVATSTNPLKMMWIGAQYLVREGKIWWEESKEVLRNDPILMRRKGEIDMLFTFENQDKVNAFSTVADSDHHEGFSHCKFEGTDRETAVFSGDLSTRVPATGTVKFSGYCAVTSKRVFKSFSRIKRHDFTQYTHLVFKIRGDGRTYQVNVSTPGDYDILWNDLYCYPLFTRGGPYWQLTKIPLTHFYLTHKGKVQDKQSSMDLHLPTRVGITCMGEADGSFQLEIEYIGLENDPHFVKINPYEEYYFPEAF